MHSVHKEMQLFYLHIFNQVFQQKTLVIKNDERQQAGEWAGWRAVGRVGFNNFVSGA